MALGLKDNWLRSITAAGALTVAGAIGPLTGRAYADETPQNSQRVENDENVEYTSAKDAPRYIELANDEENGYRAFRLGPPRNYEESGTRPALEAVRAGRDVITVLDFVSDDEEGRRQSGYLQHLLAYYASDSDLDIVYIQVPREQYERAMELMIELNNKMGPGNTHAPYDFYPDDETPEHNFSENGEIPYNRFIGPYAQISVGSVGHYLDVPYHLLPYQSADSEVDVEPNSEQAHAYRYGELIKYVRYSVTRGNKLNEPQVAAAASPAND